MEQTLVIIKPDAVRRHLIGAVFQRFEENGFSVCAIKTVTLTLEEAREFYIANRQHESYERNAVFMSSGPIVVMTLERASCAVEKARELIGSYDAQKALSGTIRKDFGIPDQDGILHVVHGSDSRTAAEREIAWFFGKSRLELRVTDAR